MHDAVSEHIICSLPDYLQSIVRYYSGDSKAQQLRVLGEILRIGRSICAVEKRGGDQGGIVSVRCLLCSVSKVFEGSNVLRRFADHLIPKHMRLKLSFLCYASSCSKSYSHSQSRDRHEQDAHNLFRPKAYEGLRKQALAPADGVSPAATESTYAPTPSTMAGSQYDSAVGSPAAQTTGSTAQPDMGVFLDVPQHSWEQHPSPSGPSRKTGRSRNDREGRHPYPQSERRPPSTPDNPHPYSRPQPGPSCSFRPLMLGVTYCPPSKAPQSITEAYVPAQQPISSAVSTRNRARVPQVSSGITYKPPVVDSMSNGVRVGLPMGNQGHAGIPHIAGVPIPPSSPLFHPYGNYPTIGSSQPGQGSISTRMPQTNSTAYPTSSIGDVRTHYAPSPNQVLVNPNYPPFQAQPSAAPVSSMNDRRYFNQPAVTTNQPTTLCPSYGVAPRQTSYQSYPQVYPGTTERGSRHNVQNTMEDGVYPFDLPFSHPSSHPSSSFPIFSPIPYLGSTAQQQVWSGQTIPNQPTSINPALTLWQNPNDTPTTGPFRR